MAKPIRYLCRGERTWMLCEDIPEDDSTNPARSTATPLLRDVDVETALQKMQAQFPEFEIRVMSWHRPKRDYSPPD